MDEGFDYDLFIRCSPITFEGWRLREHLLYRLSTYGEGRDITVSKTVLWPLLLAIAKGIDRVEV